MTGSHATTTSEQSVIDDFAASNLVKFLLLLLSNANKYQNFQGGFQYYDTMTFIYASSAHGHSSFQGTMTTNTTGWSDDEEDMPGMFLFL